MADRTDKPQPAAPKPSIEQLRRQIGGERGELEKSLDKLAGEVDEAVAAVRSQAAAVGRKARVVAPTAGGVLAALLVLRGAFRRRRRRRR